ncbi:MAG: hypothetical protein ACRC17_09275 [Culicoidibacterales bacterium]
MIRFWRYCFYNLLISTFFLKLLAFIFKIIGSTIILGSGFGNQTLFHNWYAIVQINNWGLFIFEQIFTLFCLMLSFYWIQKLSRAKKQNFKRFPGRPILLVTFLILTALSSHWSISLLFLVVFFFMTRTKINTNKNLFTQTTTI